MRFFQRTRELEVDGVAGEKTRRALIAEYMTLDGVSLSEFAGEIDATAHGCGENFPLDEEGEQVDKQPADEKRDRIDRRVELFFFDDEFGITPPPPGPNSKPLSKEYPLWRKRVASIVELTPETDGPLVAFVEFADAHFRSDSAVVLPEGEDPDATGEHQAITSVGLVATALRYNEDHAGFTLLVAGHTDTTADSAHNDELSRLRAKVALALLVGDRDSFKSLANQRNKSKDINQILSWVSEAFPDLPFACKPAAINDFVNDKTVRGFQSSYNRHKTALGATGPDLDRGRLRRRAHLGAFFDCYEFALREELGEDSNAVAELRKKLTFADEERKSLGFGERFPIEELGVDHFRSQTNRRVEVLFFEPGQEPDLAHAEDDPRNERTLSPGSLRTHADRAVLEREARPQHHGERQPGQ